VPEGIELIRPWWLLALIPLAVIAVSFRHREDPFASWRGIVADHLLEPLLGATGVDRSARPERWIVAALAVAIAALSGPSFSREESPFAQDQAALVIVLEVTESMTAGDVAPSRLERATHKIRDLLEERAGAKTALIAFAGSAHVVLPLTRDADVLTRFAEGLSPDVMPKKGEMPAEAIERADAILEKAGVPGSILLITDGFPPDRLASLDGRSGPVVEVLGVASARVLEAAGLDAVARTLGGTFTPLTPDASDVQRVARNVERSLRAVDGDGDEASQRSDHGYFLVPLLALLILPWVRRGWSVNAGAAVALVFVSAALPACGPDAWERPERRGARLIQEGRAAEAVDVFTDPMWRGAALFRAGEFEAAASAFALLTSADAHYDRGTALIMAGKYEDAVAALGEALAQRPDWREATENQEIARLRAERLQKEGGEGTGGKLGADDVVMGPGGDKGDDASSDEVELGAGGPLDDAGVRALWLRNVQTRPADFLRWKFSFQLGEREK